MGHSWDSELARLSTYKKKAMSEELYVEKENRSLRSTDAKPRAIKLA